jgi:hypothetical protein
MPARWCTRATVELACRMTRLCFSVPPMMTSDEPVRDVRPDAAVHPLSRAAQRPCSRPGCPAPARATLTFAYAQRQAWIEPLQATDEPQAYDLCAGHASRTRPPHGWQLRDRRSDDDRRLDPPPVTPPDLGGERTVAVLAAALRAVPDLAPERDARPPHRADVGEDDAGATAAAVDQPELTAPAAEGTPRRSGPEDDPSPVLGADPRPVHTRPPLAVRDGVG